MTKNHSVHASYDKIVFVTRRTALEELALRLNTRAQARFVLEQNQISFSEYERADAQYHRAQLELRRQVPAEVKSQWIERELLPTFQFGERDLVVTIGPDGLVVNTAKYLTTQPIIAINPDPARIDGVLIPFRVEEARMILRRAIEGKLRVTHATMVQATLNDGQVLHGVNDLFIGIRGHASARYSLALGHLEEVQSSSGIIISTGMGCSGWLRSLTTGAWHIARYFGSGTSAPPTMDEISLGWESEHLWYTVREPFESRASNTSLIFGQLAPGEVLTITSQMPENGIIFSDGVQQDALAFNSGAIARIALSERRACLAITG